MYHCFADKSHLVFLFVSSRMAAAATVAMACSLAGAHGRETVEPGFPSGIMLPAKANGEAAIDALGGKLPLVSAHYAVSPDQLRRHLRSDPSLWVDRNGELLYACGLGCGDCHHEEIPAETPAVESVGPIDPPPFDTTEAFLLHSRPGAKRVIYLDFDGHIDNTPGNWRDGASAPPYDLDGDETTFNSTERNRIIYIWQRVAEDFSMYDIDVTTEDPGVEALRKTSSSDAAYGIRAVIGGRSSDWYGGGAGGVAFVGSFDANQDVPCWIFSESLGETEKTSPRPPATRWVTHLGCFTMALREEPAITAARATGPPSWV